MTRFQWFFNRLAEECVEVAKNALKTCSFGIYARDLKNPELVYDNYTLTHEELDDLMGVIEKLNEEFNFNYVPNRERIDAKKKKLEEYFNHSKTYKQITE